MLDCCTLAAGHAMSALSGLTVLLVEDEPIVAMNAEDMLLDLGCSRVEVCYRVEPALEMIPAISFDAAVLDINLNGDRSFPIAEALRERSVPFAFATGFNDRETPFPGAPVIGKPYRMEELESALTQALTK